jgi:hypothetical protein
MEVPKDEEPSRSTESIFNKIIAAIIPSHGEE